MASTVQTLPWLQINTRRPQKLYGTDRETLCSHPSVRPSIHACMHPNASVHVIYHSPLVAEASLTKHTPGDSPAGRLRSRAVRSMI